jgi:hypothetical protein
VPVVVVFESPSLTQERYEASLPSLVGKDRVEALSDFPVEGQLAHIAGQGQNGFRVVDVWESEEAFQRAGERLAPVMKDLGIDAQPEIYPAHTFVAT